MRIHGRFDRNKEEMPSLVSNSQKVVVIGAGGAGKALAFGAKEREPILLLLIEVTLKYIEDGMVLLLANSTSMGMQQNVEETPISKDALKHYTLVFDAVYTPRITRLLTDAEGCGAIDVSGSEMFARQAYEQFMIFNGLTGKYLIQDKTSVLDP